MFHALNFLSAQLDKYALMEDVLLGQTYVPQKRADTVAATQNVINV